MRHNQTLHPQRGAVLITALLILIILTLIGVSAMTTSTLEEKMAGNMREKNRSFQAAETAIRTGEEVVKPLTTLPVANKTATAGIYTPDAFLDTNNKRIALEDQTITWWATNGTKYAGTLNGIANPPYHVIEYLDFLPDSFSVGVEAPTGRYFYRVTGRGTGGSASTTEGEQTLTVLQTTYIKRYN